MFYDKYILIFAGKIKLATEIDPSCDIWTSAWLLMVFEHVKLRAVINDDNSSNCFNHVESVTFVISNIVYMPILNEA